MKDADNGNKSDSQSESTKDKNTGDYVMITREVIKVLLRPDLNGQEKSIILYVADNTVGYHCQFRDFSISEFITDLAIPERTLKRALSHVLTLKILKRKHIGNKQYEYALNEEFFGRIYPGEINNVRYLDRYKKDETKCQPGHNVVPTVAQRSANTGTTKDRRAAPVADTRKIKHTSNIVLNISLSRFEDFVLRQPRATRSRWERFLMETLNRNPGDQDVLLAAIHRIEATGKDLFGEPIKRSMVALFEKTEWVLMRESLFAIMRAEKEQEDKKRKAEEQKSLLESEKNKNHLQEQEVDTSTITIPYFRKLAENKGRS